MEDFPRDLLEFEARFLDGERLPGVPVSAPLAGRVCLLRQAGSVLTAYDIPSIGFVAGSRVFHWAGGNQPHRERLFFPYRSHVQDRCL
jgi:hypothetical protein